MILAFWIEEEKSMAQMRMESEWQDKFKKVEIRPKPPVRD